MSKAPGTNSEEPKSPENKQKTRKSNAKSSNMGATLS